MARKKRKKNKRGNKPQQLETAVSADAPTTSSNINWAERAKDQQGTGDAQDMGQELASLFGLNTLTQTSRKGKGMAELLNIAIEQQGKREVLQQCALFREGDGLISALTRAKRILFTAGFRIRPQHSDGFWTKLLEKTKDILGLITRTRTLRRQLSNVVREWGLVQLVEQAIDDWETYDNVCLLWEVTDPGNGKDELAYVTTLPPHRIRNYAGGLAGKRQTSLVVDLSEDLKAYWNDLTGKMGIEEAKAHMRKLGYKEKYITALYEDDDSVTLRNDDGEYWLIRSDNGVHDGLAWPSMRTVFGDIVQRQLLVAGDFSICFFFRGLIQLIKHGEAAPSGYPGMDRGPTWSTKEDRDELRTHFQKTSACLRLFGDHTLDVEYKHPPLEALDDAKYAAVERRIGYWAANPAIYMSGEGGTYGGGFIGLKRLQSKGAHTRLVIGALLSMFLEHETVRDKIKGLLKSDTLDVLFDAQALKEHKQVLEEVRFMWQSGLCDAETAHAVLGHDHDSMVHGKLAQQALEGDLWDPPMQPFQGQGEGEGEGNDGAGRPRNPDRPPPTPDKQAGEPKPQ